MRNNWNFSSLTVTQEKYLKPGPFLWINHTFGQRKGSNFLAFIKWKVKNSASEVILELCCDKTRTSLLYVTKYGHAEIVSLSCSLQKAFLPWNTAATSVSLSCFSISPGIHQQAFDQTILPFYPWHIITNMPVTKALLPLFQPPGDTNPCLTGFLPMH